MTEQEIMDKLQTITREVLESDDIVITKKTSLESLGITSFGLVQLVCAVEEEFGIMIPNTTIKSMKNISSVVKYIKKNTKQ